MAIGFARLEFVKRASGQNACAKSAYISREGTRFHGTDFAPARTYDWSHRVKVIYNEVLIPTYVNRAFLKAEKLWNEAESKENRSNSQTAMEMVMALPDDLEVSEKDKIDLLKIFVEEHFVNKGLGAQVVIHSPESKIELNPEIGEIENLDHNWHAHVLLTTRCFDKNGEGFEDKKARYLMPSLRNGKVISGPNWGQLWTEHQNLYFESKGMSLRVDSNGSVAQIHLGPKRLRGKAFVLLEKNEQLKEQNREALKDPATILEKIVQQRNVFTPEDIRKIIYKFLGHEGSSQLVEAILNQKNVVQLLDPATGKLPIDKETGRPIEQYTTIAVLTEEKRCLNYAANIQRKNACTTNISSCLEQFSSNLSSEQKIAFKNILAGSRLSCIEGYAGTGKSYLLVALKDAYEKEGYTVRAFGPDSATAQVLKEKGFTAADNVYNFLFSIDRMEKGKNQEGEQNYWKANQIKRGQPYFSKEYKKKQTLNLQKSKEIWFIDEAAKLGNRPMLQILKYAERYDAQLVLSGSTSQLLPVERGCMYDILIKRYGSHKLEDIQRQKQNQQKEISKKIAKGEMASAINQLAATNSIIWVGKDRGNTCTVLTDRMLSMQELIKKWAIDQVAFPNASSIIIACSNQEVITLNEMVRSYRKEKGEVSKQDLLYETQFGSIFVSEGDKLEFASNDKELGVTNGMQGYLVKASPNQFTIAVKSKGKLREITFDPNKYASCKLGYATTYFRSQGRTADRAYVLHSPYTNKEMFYVALTRHVHKAYLFAPKSNFHYLSYLKAKAAGYGENYKRYLEINDYFKNKDLQTYLEDLVEQTSKANSRFATADYTSADQLDENGSLFKQIKGYVRSAWNTIAKSEEKKDAAFFSPKFPDLPEKIRVFVEKPDEPAFIKTLASEKDFASHSSWSGLSKSKQQLIKDYLHISSQALKIESPEDQINKIIEERDAAAHSLLSGVNCKTLNQLLGSSHVENLKQQGSFYKKSIQKDGKTLNYQTGSIKDYEPNKLNSLKPLSPEKQKLLNTYQKASYDASLFYTLVQAEREIGKETTHYTAWQVACGKRNQAAYNLTQDVLEIIPDRVNMIREQAARHERLISLRENHSVDLESKLKDNLEVFLYRLFPEGPTRKERSRWRFGSNGSLAVVCQGDKIGSYYSFEEGEGGGPLGLIQKTLGLNSYESRDWANNFLGEAKNVAVPRAFKTKSEEVSSEWIAIKPPQSAPALKQLSKIAFHYREVARHRYVDANGDLLFYTLRLVDKKDPTKKIILPLSYGIEKGGQPHWKLKAFQASERPLYNLNLLKQNARVVIVEGEKTADAANKLLAKYGMICLTWSGGAGATKQSDWTPLAGREVVIWPDNDQEGYKAADAICSTLRKVGVKSLHVVDTEILSQTFPKKWDLADPLPEGKKESFIRDLLLNAKEKGVSINHLGCVTEYNRVEFLRAQEVLWRVEERLRPQLEKDLKERPNDIRKTIIDETVKILNEKDKIKNEIIKQLSLSDTQGDFLSFQATLYRAEKGSELSHSKLTELKETMKNLKGVFVHGASNYDKDRLIVDKILASAFDQPISRNEIAKQFNQSDAYAHQFYSSSQKICKTNGKDMGFGL